MAPRRSKGIISQAPRTSLGPGQKGSENLDASLSENNDEAEKRERARRTLVEVQLSASPRPSPRPSESSRHSFGSIANLNSVQLAEHFKNCMKLSNENKINAKNAFQLQLIDYMAMMLKRKESELDNFQVASCTLDASAKIYAYRVDCVHSDAVKMAGSLIRSDNKKKGDDRSDDEEGDRDDEGGADKPAKKKRVKRRVTVESNLKNLDSKEVDSDFKLDPFFKRMATKFDEGQSGGCHFLANLRVLDETQEIILSSDRSWWRETGGTIKSAEVCPSFSNFTFNGWSPENDESAIGGEFGAFGQDQVLGRDAEHAFDINAVPEAIETSDIGMDVDNGPDENTVGTVEVMGFERKQGGKPSWELTDLRNVLSLNPQEYSYFKKGIGWAGPSHWKVKPLLKSNQPKATGKRKPKTVVSLAYEDSCSVDDFSKQSEKSIRLTDATIEKWSDMKTTLPEDLHLDVSSLLKFFAKPKMGINSRKSDAVNLEGVDPYNFDNLNDKENYCTNFEGDDDIVDDDDRDISDFGHENSLQNDELSQAESGYNLVKAPNMVPNVFIPYAKRAKRMDMKRLQKTVFDILTHQNKKETTEADPKESEAPEVKGKVEFSKVFYELPKKLPQKDAQNLSFALAFAALLHTANDNTLLIEGTPDLSDMIISQDKKLC
ncbi:hypothetical protein J437_LFUL011339 [Ladona fulva]|uniref:Condensin complex subunit 2 n=1 Tax=Ladona fulva TaxID=123851 RepID=A0A8K0K9B7_LADFU|nr:hypothetical protein J437_LFUL011339 [Ladona fulva]